MKKITIVLLLISVPFFLKAQINVKTIDSYGVKFIVAEKVPEQLMFLMGTYKNLTDNKRYILNADGTGTIDGLAVKYWFEATDKKLIGKKPWLGFGSDSKPNRADYTVINIIVQLPEHDDLKPLTVIPIILTIKGKNADIFGYTKEINCSETIFNAITETALIAPSYRDTNEMCASISIQEQPSSKDKAYFDYGYEHRLMDMVGVDITKESREAATEKISKWWNKYKTLYRCQSSTFDVQHGNILKFAVVQAFAPFLETIVSTYQMDINFIDPIDKRNVLDYVNDELSMAIKLGGPVNAKVNMLKKYKELLEDLGGKPSK